MNGIYPLLGFRAFRAEVRRELTAAGANPLGVSDRAIIDAWLEFTPADAFAISFIEQLDSSTVEQRGGAQ